MPKLLLVGWDGAGWDPIHPLMDSGAMPNLSRLVEQGVMGNLGTLTPPCSPLLWSSIATGLFADRHGVLDSAEPDPVTSGVRPVTRTSVRERPVWDLLAEEGIRCQVVGWPATHPATGPAVCVSDGFAYGVPGSIYPQSLESTLLPLRFDPREWTGDELQLFVPEFARIDQDKDMRLAKLAVVLAEAVSVHAAATTLLEFEESDFCAVWFGTLGRAFEVLAAASNGETDPDHLYRAVFAGVHRMLDLFLGRLLHLAGPDAVVMLAGDRTVGESEWRASYGHGRGGLLCAAGPRIEPDELTFGAGLLDIAPTVLASFGFRPAPGMTGRALIEVCPTAAENALRHTGVSSHYSESLTEPPADVRQLEEFGYVDSIAAGWRAEAEAAQSRRDFNLARVLLAQGRPSEAAPLFQRLSETSPDAIHLRLYLGHTYFRNGQIDQCRAICEELVARDPHSPFAQVGRAHLALAEEKYEEALSYLEAGRKDYGMIAALDAVVGQAYLKMGRPHEAQAAYRSAIAADPGLAAAHEGLAHVLHNLRQYSEAAEAALDAIRLHYDLPEAHRILALSLEAMGRDREAEGAVAAFENCTRRTPVA